MGGVNDKVDRMVQKPNLSRGRPRSFDPDAALDAAIAIFLKYGYDGATLDHLTNAMGIGRPSLYAAFGDKRTLFAKALHRYGETTGSDPVRAFDVAPDIRAAARAFLTSTILNITRAGCAAGCLFACCASAVASTQDETRAFLRDVLATTTRLLEARFQESASVGELSDATPSSIRALLLIDLIQGMAVRARAGEERDELLQCVDGYVAVICK